MRAKPGDRATSKDNPLETVDRLVQQGLEAYLRQLDEALDAYDNAGKLLKGVAGKPDIALACVEMMETFLELADRKQGWASEMKRIVSQYQLWWVDTSLQDQLMGKGPADVDALIALVKDQLVVTINGYAESGVPESPERDTVRYGMTLFGEPARPT